MPQRRTTVVVCNADGSSLAPWTARHPVRTGMIITGTLIVSSRGEPLNFAPDHEFKLPPLGYPYSFHREGQRLRWRELSPLEQLAYAEETGARCR